MSCRSIQRVVNATRVNPSLHRLIGSVDVDGAGTDHPLSEVDPFILLDAGTIAKNGMPPFGAHPHYGHSVVTVLLGGSLSSWDSFSFPTRDGSNHVISAPASYWVDAGSGVFHEERSVIENEDDPSQHARLFQLWVGVREEDRAKPARVQYDNALPVEEIFGNRIDGAGDGDGGGGDAVRVGTAIHHVGPATTLETPHPISVVHVTQEAGTTYRMPVEPSHGGFVVSIKGGATFGGTQTTVATGDGDTNTVLVLADVTEMDAAGGDDATAAYLDVQTSPDAAAEYLVCAGEKIGESWAKKLVANGAVIASTDKARALATKVELMSARGKGGDGIFAPFGRETMEP